VRLPTASEIELALTCSGSALLPRHGLESQWMSLGITKGAFFEALIGGVGREQALAAIADPDTRAVCEALDLDGLPLEPAAYAAEVAFAWSPITGAARELGRGLERDYSAAAEGEMVGTADVIALLGDDGVLVADWKGEHAHVTAPARNPQLRWLALAACRAYGRRRAVVEIIRPGEDRAWRERAELDAFDLAEIAEEMRALVQDLQRAAADVPRLVLGEHCRRCKSMPYCPAQTALVRDLAAGDGALVTRMAESLTPDTARAAWHRLQAAKGALERIEQALRTYASFEPISLGDGRVFGPQRIRRESLDGTAVFHVLRERYGEAKAWEGVELKATKAGLDRALRPIAQEGKAKITHLTRDVLGEVEARGGLRASEREEVRVHRVKESAP